LGLTGAAIRATTLAFGGEDPLGTAPAPNNWHHEGLTRQAARAPEWSALAQNALAFHADYLDSYLYNPLWWFDLANGGGPDRLTAVMSSRSELVKLHFDDLVHPESVRGMWRRYLSGTAAGLIWLGGVDSAPIERRVAMAQNLVGASLHAVQDFYSHSNWIDDDELRQRTWFEVDPEQRDCLSLWTGTYEQPEHVGILPHGAFVYACTVINNLGPEGQRLLSAICHAASPYADSSLCHWFRQCLDARPLQPPTVGDGAVTLPPNVLWVEPGINVDNRWSAETGVKIRGLTITGTEAFEAAFELAYRCSCQWLHILGHVMEDAHLQEFWQRVKQEGVTTEQYKTPGGPWEDFAQIPYRFISVGPYPPPLGFVDTDTWYLRLSISTGGDGFAGTDADIVPFVNGRRFPVLDHGVPPSPVSAGQPPMRTLDQTLLGHNDFEAGDVAAYMIGPLDEAPHTVALLNDAPDAGDVIQAAADGVWRALVAAFDSIVDFFKGLWGYNADFVGEAHWTISAATLGTLGAGQRRYFYLECDGRSEGNYVVSGFVEGTSGTGRFPNGVPWRRFRVVLESLFCVKESEWDRGTTSDEPFVLALVIPHGGLQRMISWRSGPYGGVNSGDVNPIGQSWIVDVPQGYGFISVACAVYESDDETDADRNALLGQFAGSVGGGIVEAEDTFLEVLDEALAAGWMLGSVEPVAFRRSPTVEVRAYEPETFDRWVDGGHQVEWSLTEQAVWSINVPDTLDCGHAPCTGDVVVPPAEPEVAQIDFRPKPGSRGDVIRDPGHEAMVDLAEFDPRCRPRPKPGDGDLAVDEPSPVPRPKDGCG
jgi:hypothetical protein